MPVPSAPPGPATLGRGVVVAIDGPPVPAAWADPALERVRIDDATLSAPADAVARLHAAWSTRRPVVVELAVDPARFRDPTSSAVEPWTLDADHELWADRLHHLVWANTYDARQDGDPVWWWARKAIRLGASPTTDGRGDVVLADGRPAWIDGGPRGPEPSSDPDALGELVLVHAESVELGALTPAPSPRPPAAELAADQLAAVTHGAGPARIIAPAGSGKTRVLTERLRHLIVDRGVESELVLAVAYNKKAQEELEARTVDFRPRVQTLNALGYSILGQARGRRPTVLDERSARDLVRSVVPKVKRRANTDPIAPYLEALSLVRLGLLDPDEVEAGRDDVPGLGPAFVAFRHALRHADAVDFDEQIYGAVEALLADGALRRRIQARGRHLLVDELQDLTPAHVLLVRLVAGPSLDVFGVGDDDQVIYGHAGADPGFLIDFARRFPGAADHPLTVNYRCPVPVVDAARHLLSYNHRRVPKEMHPGPDAIADPAALTVRTHAPDAGARALVEVVSGWLDPEATQPAAPAQVAVLSRVNSLLLAPHVVLAEAGIPLDSVLHPSVLDRLGLRAALAYLRLGASGAADGRLRTDDLVEILRRPSRGLPPWFAERLGRRGWWTDQEVAAIGDSLADKDAAKVDRLVADVGAVVDAVAAGHDTRRVLMVITDEVGLGGAISLLDASKGGEGASHVDDLEGLAQLADLHRDPTTFEAWLRAALHREATPGGVTLSTVHRVKGMEWDRVAVFGTTAGIIPHRLADDLEEERRVLHVAITRGRRQVVVLGDASRPSPFLAELDGRAPHTPATPAPVRTRTAGTGSAKAPSAPSTPLTPAQQAADTVLRAWRLQRSKADQVPAFIVLSDRHLRGIAMARPTTLVELSRLEGIGPTKLENYGEEILAVLDALDA